MRGSRANFAVEAQEAQLDVSAAIQLAQMKKMHAYIAVRGGDNITEMSRRAAGEDEAGLEEDEAGARLAREEDEVVRAALAVAEHGAERRDEHRGVREFLLRCLHARLRADAARHEGAQGGDGGDRPRARSKGPGTDLRFSHQGHQGDPLRRHAQHSRWRSLHRAGENSVQGVRAPTMRRRSTRASAFDNVRLEFKDGKIVNATANNTEKLNEILDSDAGARYIGEFAIGFNPHILQPMRDILFDEKINGSFHFTPGQCYEETENGNRSQVHWDMVNIQREDYGGGTIHFDGKLIRENGRFVPKPLQALNPERLK